MQRPWNRAKFGLSRNQANDQSGWSTENKGIRGSKEVTRVSPGWHHIDLGDQDKDFCYIKSSVEGWNKGRDKTWCMFQMDYSWGSMEHGLEGKRTGSRKPLPPMDYRGIGRGGRENGSFPNSSWFTHSFSSSFLRTCCASAQCTTGSTLIYCHELCYHRAFSQMSLSVSWVLKQCWLYTWSFTDVNPTGAHLNRQHLHARSPRGQLTI